MAMLQLSGTLSNATVRTTPRVSWWVTAQHLLPASSIATNPSPAPDSIKEEKVDKLSEKPRKVRNALPTNRSLISAAFKSLIDLNKEQEKSKKVMEINERIHSATTINEVLNLTNDQDFNHQNASSVVQILCDWLTTGKIQLQDVKNDKRYLKVCRLLGIERSSTNLSVLNKFEDGESYLTSVLKIEKAKKQIERLNVHELVEVLSSFASKQRRTTPLLKILASKIAIDTNKLNIKELADILYSMAVLTFYDEELVRNICKQLLMVVPQNERAAVIGSIITSIGLLRYRDEELLNVLSNWIVEHRDIIRPQENTSLMMTLAYLGFTPNNFDKVLEHIIKPLKESEMCQSSEWLDIVWSLSILNEATCTQYESVLNSGFISRLSDISELWPSRMLKLLNINAAAQLLKTDYKGPLIPEDSPLFSTLISRTKDKTELSNAVVSALQILLPSDSNYLNVNVNTKMGFLLDADFFVDECCTPLSNDSTSNKDKKVFRIGVLAGAYHEFCRGTAEIVGPIKLHRKLLEVQGYNVLLIPYTKINVRDKLVTRVKYLNDNIKLLIQEASK